MLVRLIMVILYIVFTEADTNDKNNEISIEVDAFANTSPTKTGRKYKITRPDNPEDHRLYKKLPKVMKELVKEYGYDVPKEEVDKIRNKYYNNKKPLRRTKSF